MALSEPLGESKGQVTLKEVIVGRRQALLRNRYICELSSALIDESICARLAWIQDGCLPRFCIGSQLYTARNLFEIHDNVPLQTMAGMIRNFIVDSERNKNCHGRNGKFK